MNNASDLSTDLDSLDGSPCCPSDGRSGEAADLRDDDDGREYH